MNRDIKQVLEEKLRELRICQQHVACLKIVLPLLVEDGDKPPEIVPAEKRDARGWVEKAFISQGRRKG